MFFIALSVITKNWKQSKISSMGDWLNKWNTRAKGKERALNLLNRNDCENTFKKKARRATV